MPIYLASASPRRRVLLEQLGLNFEVIVSSIDETVEAELPPEQLVEVLARSKAQAVAAKLESGIVIGADTIVVREEQVLGKPSTAREAREMLQLLQDAWHAVFTGLAVIDAHSGRAEVTHECTRVKFKPLTEDEITRYVATGEPLDKAGSYAIQGLGAIFIEQMQGCYFNVVGLPLAKLAEVLKGFGVEVLQPV